MNSINVRCAELSALNGLFYDNYIIAEISKEKDYFVITAYGKGLKIFPVRCRQLSQLFADADTIFVRISRINDRFKIDVIKRIRMEQRKLSDWLPQLKWW